MFDTDGNQRVDKNEFLVVSIHIQHPKQPTSNLTFEFKHKKKYFDFEIFPKFNKKCNVIDFESRNRHGKNNWLIFIDICNTIR